MEQSYCCFCFPRSWFQSGPAPLFNYDEDDTDERPQRRPRTMFSSLFRFFYASSSEDLYSIQEDAHCIAVLIAVLSNVESSAMLVGYQSTSQADIFASIDDGMPGIDDSINGSSSNVQAGNRIQDNRDSDCESDDPLNARSSSRQQ
jgi:hypothetical protein